MSEFESPFDNRELSWLKFNKRVLEEAADESNPLMERFLFEAIFSCNLDEFFMVRTGTLIRRMLEDDSKPDNKTLLRPSEQLKKIYCTIHELLPQKDSINSKIESALSSEGVRRLSYDRLNKEQKKYVDDLFDHEIRPFLNKYLIGDGDIFPFLENKKIYTAVRYEKSNGSYGTSIISDTSESERTVILPSDNTIIEYILKEDIILANISLLFEQQTIIEKLLIRAVRSAALTLDDEPVIDSDRLEAMTMVLAKRRLMPIVRLQLSCEPSQLFKDILSSAAEVSAERIFTEKTPLDMRFVNKLYPKTLNNSKLHYVSYTPAYPERIDKNTPIYDQVRKKDLLLSYPYESISPFIRMLEEAADDERVTDIKITIYRVADDSKIISALCRAAKNCKNVTVCTELRARFDEQHNITCAEILRDSGCNVIFGIPGIKVHSKLCLIKRICSGEPTYITQIGTGNYNENTARLYTDFTLITSDIDIAEDAERMFTELEQGKTTDTCSALMLSPDCLRDNVLSMLDDEIRHAQNGEPAYFGAKMNGLTDKAVIDKLIEASRAGVKIDLIVRGVCCVVSGVKEYTENIRVVSIVGRFLEHARIYIFGKGERTKVYISSADLMTRNTCRRIEAAAPIKDAELKKKLLDYFDHQLRDDTKARIQQSDAEYIKLNGNTINCQRDMMIIEQPAQNKTEEPEPDSAKTVELTSSETQPTEEKRPGFFKRLLMFFTKKKRH